MNYFNESEFMCSGKPCFDKMDTVFLDMLNLARSYSNHPFIISSSWRSTEHNLTVGGSRTSSHLKGLAVDIEAKTSSARYEIINSLLKAGFTRIGIGSDFIHVDIDSDKPQNLVWTY